jgi:hypothetical protein
MAKKSVEKPKNRSGPRAPAGKKPLMVIIDEKVIEDAKVAAIRDKTKVSAIVEELLRRWLDGRPSSKKG